MSCTSLFRHVSMNAVMTGSQVSGPQSPKIVFNHLCRHLTPELRGVLAETALAGVNRFPFSLIKPVLEQLLEEVSVPHRQALEANGLYVGAHAATITLHFESTQTLKDYEKSQAEEEGSIGPVRPVLDGGVSLTEAINRFRSQIESFNKVLPLVDNASSLLLCAYLLCLTCDCTLMCDCAAVSGCVHRSLRMKLL